ncbi:MAG: SRPBCC family protein [Cyanobacteria bacterium P01_D01_bin.36]
MSFVKKAVIGVVGFVAIALIGGFVLPSNVHVERQLLMSASPAEIFAEVSDFNQWDDWSPWANIDPEATVSVVGEGLGQTMTWTSDNPEVGNGMQQVTQMDAPRAVKTHLDFGDMGSSDAMFTLNPADGGTLVTWSLDTDMREGVPLVNKPMSTYFGFFMDSTIGSQYEEGLANLKRVVES